MLSGKKTDSFAVQRACMIDTTAGTLAKAVTVDSLSISSSERHSHGPSESADVLVEVKIQYANAP